MPGCIFGRCSWRADLVLLTPVRGFLLAICIGVVVSMGVSGRAAADPRKGAIEPGRSIRFDLPAQPLVSALEGYSVASGWQVIYDASLANERRSTPVTGEFTPVAALRTLLAGTGLMVKYMAADGVMLVPDPAARNARREMADDAQSPFGGYYGRLQEGLKQALCAAPQLRSGAYRIAIGFWIGPSGSVTRAALLGSTGRADVDASFQHAVQMAAFGGPPPIGFAQPVVLLVTPDLVSQCGETGSPVQPAGAGQ